MLIVQAVERTRSIGKGLVDLNRDGCGILRNNANGIQGEVGFSELKLQLYIFGTFGFWEFNVSIFVIVSMSIQVMDGGGTRIGAGARTGLCGWA